MKKTIWGYKIKEVDDAFEGLVKQNTSLIQRNDALEDELKKTNVELERLHTQQEHVLTKAEFDEYKEIKTAYEALQHRVAEEEELERKLQKADEERDRLQQELDQMKTDNEERDRLQQELDQLKQDYEELQSRPAEVVTVERTVEGGGEGGEKLLAANAECDRLRQVVEQMQAEMEQLQADLEKAQSMQGEIDVSKWSMSEFNSALQQACTAVADTKENAYKKMMGIIGDFGSCWEGGNREILASMTRFDQSCTEMQITVDSFLKTIKTYLDQIIKGNMELHTQMDRMAARRKYVENELRQSAEQIMTEDPLMKPADPLGMPYYPTGRMDGSVNVVPLSRSKMDFKNYGALG